MNALASVKDDHRVVVRWAENSLRVGAEALTWDAFRPWCPQPVVYSHYVYPGYRWQSPTEMAFKVVSRLLEQGVVKDLTLKEFVALVDDIARTLR